MTWFGKTLRSVAALGFAVLFLALSELLMTFAPSKLMLELRAGLLIFAAPSKLDAGASGGAVDICCTLELGA